MCLFKLQAIHPIVVVTFISRLAANHLLAREESLGYYQSDNDSSSGNHEYLQMSVTRILLQAVQWLLTQ